MDEMSLEDKCKPNRIARAEPFLRIRQDDDKSVYVEDSSIVVMPGKPVNLPANATTKGYQFVLKHWKNSDFRFEQINYQGGEAQKKKFMEYAINYFTEAKDHYRTGYLKLRFNEDYEGALGEFEAMLQKDPNDYVALKSAGFSKQMLGHDDYETYFIKAAKYAPNREAKTILKYTETEAGKYFKAKEVARQNIPVTKPLTPEQKAKLAEAAKKKEVHVSSIKDSDIPKADLDKITKSLFNLEDIAQDSADRKIVSYENGTFSLQDDADSRTFAYLVNCIRDSQLNILSFRIPGDSPKQMELGQRFMDYAMNEFEKSVDMVNLGNLNLRMENFEDALAYFEAMKRIDENNSKAYIGSCYAKYKSGMLTQAMQDLETAQKLDSMGSEWLSQFIVTEEAKRKEAEKNESFIKKAAKRVFGKPKDITETFEFKNKVHNIRQDYVEYIARNPQNAFSGKGYEAKLRESKPVFED